MRASPTPSSSFTPTAPLSFTTPDSVLSEDYISTSDIVVDPTSTAPVAVFSNAGDTESVVITNGQVAHVHRDPTTDSGWNITSVGGSGVLEVAAGVQFDQTVHAFWEDSVNLYHSGLQGDGTWLSPPTSLPLCTGLKVAYTPNVSELILYGVTSTGDLQIVRQTEAGGPWTALTCGMDGALAGGNPVLCMVDERNWTVAAAASQVLTLWTGQVGQAFPASGPVRVTTPTPVAQVVLGYWSGRSALFAFVDSTGVLRTCVRFSDESTPVQPAVPNSQVSQVSGLVDTNGMLHIYSIDDQARLWVLHQTGWGNDGAPTWAPYIPLDCHISRAVTDTLPTDAVDIFAVDDTAALRFHTQDQVTGNWSTSTAQQPALLDAVYPVSRYRTEVTLLDANGTPAPNYQVSVGTDSTCALWISGNTYAIDTQTPASVTTDIFGKLTLATLATSLSAPCLSLSALGASPTTIEPSRPVHTYLAGGPPLNDLQTFGPTTLQNAQVDGQSLAPVVTGPNPALSPEDAANAIINAMSIKLPNSTATPTASSAGWALHLRGPSPGLVSFAHPEDLETHLNDALATGLLGGFWDDVENFLDDVWHGIETAAITISAILVDAVQGTVTFAVQVGDEVQHLAGIAIRDIDDAVSVVHGVFAAIGAAAEKVIEWLKALFSWSAIWNTKTVLESALTQAGPYVHRVIQDHAQPLVNGAFSKLENFVHQQIESLKSSLTEGQSLESMVTGLQPTTSAAVTGQVREQVPARCFSHLPLAAVSGGSAINPSTFTSSAHHNWFLDKVMSYLEGYPPLPTISTLSQPLSDLSGAFEAAGGAFQTALDDFSSAFHQAVQHPKDFPSVGIADLLDMLDDLAQGVLTLADGLVNALLDIFVAVLASIDELWTAPLEIPFISSLVKEIANLAEPGSDPEISVASLFCLLAAFPLTLVYKLVHDGEEPFPGGVLPLPEASSRDAVTSLTTSTASEACRFTGVGIQAAWSLYDTALDANEDPDVFALNVIDIVFSVLGRVFPWPTDNKIPFTEVPFETAGHDAVFANWMVGWAFPLVNTALLLAPADVHAPGLGGTIARYSDPVGKVLVSALGAGNIISGVVESVLAHEGGATIAANILGPLASTTQFLRLDAVEEASDGVSIPIKLLIDFFTGEGCAVAMAVG